MKARILTLFFILISFAEISLVAAGEESFRYLTKPLIIPCLVTIYLVEAGYTIPLVKNPILMGLFFSWIGDILLQMEGQFVAGLASFLIAHLCYIVFFFTTRSEHISFFKLRPVMLFAVMAYLIELLYLLWPHLGPMKLPVLLYGITISVMLSAALWQYQKLDNATAVYFILGAAFFVLSDSILAINKFRQSFEGAGIFIMTTYIIAQHFIVRGAIRYTKKGPVKHRTFSI